MTHLIVRKTSEDERTAFTPSLKASVIDDIHQPSSKYAHYMEEVESMMEEMFGAGAIIKSFGFFWRWSTATKEQLAAYLDAKKNNRFTDAIEQSLIQSAGKKKAGRIIAAINRSILHQEELKEMLAEYSAAYTECALDLPINTKERHLAESQQALQKSIGPKRTLILMRRIAERVDAELNDYLARAARGSAAFR